MTERPLRPLGWSGRQLESGLATAVLVGEGGERQFAPADTAYRRSVDFWLGAHLYGRSQVGARDFSRQVVGQDKYPS